MTIDDLLAEVRAIPPLPPLCEEDISHMVARMTGMTPCAVIYAHTSERYGMQVSLQIRRPAGGLQSGFECQHLRAWATAVDYHTPRRSVWMAGGEMVQEEGPFDNLAEKLEEMFAKYSPAVCFMVDEHLGGW